MNEITPFTFPVTGQPVRTVTIDGEVWFVGADVTAVLGYANGRRDINRHVAEHHRGVYRIGTPSGDQQMLIIDEPGVYRLAMRSNLPAAEEFQEWIASKVLPSIRKTGAYLLPVGDQLAQIEALAAAASQAVAIARQAEARVAELEPSAQSWDTLAAANGDLLVGDAAKILNRDHGIKTGRDRLFATLAELGWTYRSKADKRWRAYQTAIEAGRLSELPLSYTHPDTGELTLAAPQLRVTVKGLGDLARILGAKAWVA